MPDDYLIHPDRISEEPHRWEGTFMPSDLERLEENLAGPDGELPPLRARQ